MHPQVAATRPLPPRRPRYERGATAYPVEGWALPHSASPHGSARPLLQPLTGGMPPAGRAPAASPSALVVSSRPCCLSMFRLSHLVSHTQSKPPSESLMRWLTSG